MQADPWLCALAEAQIGAGRTPAAPPAVQLLNPELELLVEPEEEARDDSGERAMVER